MQIEASQQERDRRSLNAINTNGNGNDGGGGLAGEGPLGDTKRVYFYAGDTRTGDSTTN